MERPKKEEPHEDDSIPHEVLTDVFHVSSDGDKFTEYGSKRFSADYGMPGKLMIRKRCFLFELCVRTLKMVPKKVRSDFFEKANSFSEMNEFPRNRWMEIY